MSTNNPIAPIRVTVWNEFRHERNNPEVTRIYPAGIHEAIATGLRTHPGLAVTTAHLDEPEHGLTTERLIETDVLIWWGHMAHAEVQDPVVERVCQGVLDGMGLIVLHSGHFSKMFKRLMGTGCNLKWRVGNDREIVWVTRPGHRIAQGIDDHFIIDHEEMYGEYFDIPEPMETVFISSFSGGEVFRSGCTWIRGAGRVFYFRPGHETFPTYFNPQVIKVIQNGCDWAAPSRQTRQVEYGKCLDGWLGRGA